jgi:exosortase
MSLLIAMSLAIPVAKAFNRQWDWLVWTAIIAGFLALLYGSILEGLVVQWWADPDYGHGFLVPIFSAYVLWSRRARILATEIRPNNLGLLLALASICMLFLGSLGAELFISRVSFLVLCAGMILFLAGWKMLRVVSFPLAFLIFMVPLPAIIYNEITLPLQLLASRLASSWLEFVHVPVLRQGNVLLLSNYSLQVVEACSGIRSLISLVTLAIAYSYLAEPRLWARYALAVLMVPSALVTNALRIVIAGLAAHRFGRIAAEGFLHEFSGWLVFVTALILLLLIRSILSLFGKAGTTDA